MEQARDQRLAIVVRMLQDVEQVATLDVEDVLFEPDAALRPELRVLASSQSKYFTGI